MKVLTIGGSIALVLAALYYFGMRAAAHPDKPQQLVVESSARRGPELVASAPTPTIAPVRESRPDSRRVVFDENRLAKLAPTDSRRQMVADFEAFVERAKVTAEQRSRLLALYADLALAHEIAVEANQWDHIMLFREYGPDKAKAMQSDPTRESLMLQALREMKEEADRRAREILNDEQYEIYQYTLLGSAAHMLAADLPLTVSP